MLHVTNGDSVVDGVLFEFLAREPLADLRFGQLAPREHAKRRDVGGISRHRP